jgi:hypothetical protein
VVGAPSRRALLGAGALAALAAAGCGDRRPAKPRGGDAAVLGTLAATERALSGAWSAHTVPARDDVVDRLRGHARSLAVAGAAPDRTAPAAVTRAADAAASAQGRDGALDALVALEQAAGTAYLRLLPELRGPEARALATGLYAASAQRASVLLAARGGDPLPDAFAGTLT